jgi:hypothetical protein
MAVQASHRRLLPATRDDAEPLALLRKHRRKPQKSMPSTDPEPRGPRAAIRLVPSRNMPLGRTSIPEFPDSGPPRPPSQHIEMSACFPSSSHRGRTHAGQPGVPGIKYFPFLGPVGVMLLRCTIWLERTGHWTRMRRSLARFSGSDASYRMSWLAGCITNTPGFRFFGTDNPSPSTSAPNFSPDGTRIAK